ncbi:MAG TPA: hypothetical protein VMU17_03150 [Elusimicrobiota bacterium]|nr:hypothetical protein [Elusimicrobiota bacterium]
MALISLPLAADQTAMSAASPSASPTVAGSTPTVTAAPVETPSAPPAAAPAPASEPAAQAPAPAAPVSMQLALNEMTGTVLSVDADNDVLRLTVDNQFNVDFTWNSKTAVTNGGHKIAVPDLNYGDKVVVRYSGKELQAVQIERLSKAPPAIPAAPPTDETPPPEPPLPPLQ